MAKLRVAIVGGGPRGLWAVEELLNLAWQRALELDITVFDHGGIKAYDLSQPDYWILNVDARIVETTTLGSFNTYTGNSRPYPPRAAVGEFFAEAWRQLPIPPSCTLQHRDEEITAPAELCTQFDQVLDVRGHQASWEGQLPDALRVYPHGQLADISAGSSVAIRGTALTFIDAVLDLTQGRGGQFTDAGYQPSGQEPAVIRPVNRRGRFMDVKPDPGVVPDLVEISNRFGPQVLAAQSTRDIVDTVLAAARCLTDDPAVSDVLDVDQPEVEVDPVAELKTSLRVARGELPLNARAAVGVAFRALYPQLVERVSFNSELTGFRELARHLEPIAFGPPADNASKIVSLLDAGLIEPPTSGDFPEADFTIDAVLAPPPNPPVRTDRDGFIGENLAVIGRATELWVLGNDTLSRTQHDVIPRWARRVVAGISPTRVHGLPPLAPTMSSWSARLSTDRVGCAELLAEFGSPVNVVNPSPMLNNAAELVAAGEEFGVDVRVFYARKANKALAFVDAMRDAGQGIDVASFRELAQVLAAGVPGDRIIVSAAIKSDELLQLAIDNGVTISVDSVSELDRIKELACRPTAIAPRLAPNPASLPPTRFGERSTTWQQALAGDLGQVRVTGVHVHLHGYAAADRVAALREACTLIDALTSLGHQPEFIDLGGGVPMSYLHSEEQWRHFQQMRARLDGVDKPGQLAEFTWKNDPLRTLYPYWQRPTRGTWLREILRDIARELRSRGLRLHLEPGRSLLDGCGLILAHVEFVKKRSDGVALVGVAMNRTQCRTTSDDFTIDPVLLPADPNRAGAEIEAYLVGAYCIEDEVILRRRIRFPRGVQRGDIIAIPNTAGYFMHILESASHQIPLAKNVVWPAGELDRIDE
ncbi:FAD/NAD(P)-binding protein [Corynebacterium epidermidicanis]|uniref:Diaminopimelate decarboxylase n=1 Tax=Corynebacterium epidermidicanis TaxID=1050174 RepID=A0A0G3GKY6_9CORY|nr:FAD/NAD(P)-binding protein [Corynebacterium epidermidicanis]AKK01906.1 diaminopimelate decarboxylase [Corynebacterium epidermidicanis]